MPSGKLKSENFYCCRYTTKHLNDEQTPKAVKQMLGLTV